MWPPLISAVLLTLLCAGTMLPLEAQEKPSGTPGSATPDTSMPPTGAQRVGVESLETLPPGTNVYYKDPQTGRVLYLPGFSQELLNSVLERSARQADAPLYDLQSLSITGQVRDNLAHLTIDAVVELRATGEWVPVSLEFSDFQLIEPDPQHTYDGSETGRQRFEKDRLPLKSWQLFGKGIHRLQFHLVGPVRPASNARQRLRLTPPVANLSHLTLTLPGNVPAAELSTSKPMDLQTDPESDLSTLETWGMTEATDITWTPPAIDTDRPRTVQATSPAQLRLDLTTKPASLSVSQPLAISGGTMDRLMVNLPSGFTNAVVSGTDAAGDPIVSTSELSETGAMEVVLVAPLSGALTLNYEMELAEHATDVTIALPNVLAATNETGDLELIAPAGLEVTDRLPDDGSVRQKRVESTPENRADGTARAAYRLLSEGAELQLSIRETEAFYSVAPVISLETEVDSVLLSARFSVNVVRGSLNELTINWPGYVADGWRILETTAPATTDSASGIVRPLNDGDRLKVEFSVRQSRQFTVELQALRDLKSFTDERDRLFLPDITSPTSHSTTISLTESDAHSMRLSADGDSRSLPQLPRSRWPEMLRSPTGPMTVWLVDAPDKALHLKMTRQRPEIRIAAVAAISVAGESLHVQETLSCDVRHQDISEISLITGSVNATVRLSTSETPLELRVSQDNLVTWNLPGAMRGEFDLVVDYYWTPPGESAASDQLSTAIPLVLPSSADANVQSVTVATSDTGFVTVRPSPDWARIYSPEYAAAWIAGGVAQSVPVSVRQPLRSTDSVRTELLVMRSAMLNGELMTSTTAVLNSEVSSILFSVPASCEIMETMLGKREFPTMSSVMTAATLA
ncbi:MAG: hypothetical protein R3C49_15365 [Planctomycetaceae bacterium]